MSILLEDNDQYKIIKLQGDFDAALVDQSREVFATIADQSEKNVLVDMSNVVFIDSSGIGAIVFLYKRLRCKELELILKGLNGQPFELIQLLRIDKIIPIIDK